MASTLRLEPGEYVLEVDGSSAFVGTLALEQSANASTARGDVNRYWSGHTLRLLMVLAGTLIKAPTFTVRIVTGLPVKVWVPSGTITDSSAPTPPPDLEPATEPSGAAAAAAWVDLLGMEEA